MSSLMSRAADILGPQAHTPSRLEREVQQAVDLEAARGVVRSARIQAAAYVAHVGLNQVAALTAEEGRLIAQAPLGEARYRAICDTFAGVVTQEVARMGLNQR